MEQTRSPSTLGYPASWGEAVMIHGKLAISSWAGQSEQPPMAQRKHQAGTQVQACWEESARARATAPRAALWEKGRQRTCSPLGYRSEKSEGGCGEHRTPKADS